MKITKIEDLERGYVAVTFTPGWFGKLFGRKEKKIQYRQNGYYFQFGGGDVWVSEQGDKVTNMSTLHDALEKHRRKQEF